MINQSRASSHINSDSRFLLQVCIGTLCRLVLVTARRLIYPFAPSLSRNLGVSLESVTFIIAANQITAITGIFLGPIADRLGYRLMMLIGMFLLVVGMVYGWLLADLCCDFSRVFPGRFRAKFI